MIDLHTHTIFSDGTWTIEEMLSNAEKAGISTLAITDHDTAMPHIKLKEIDTKSYFSGRIIVGGEFNAIFDNIKIELLGYDFNPELLQEWINKTYNTMDEIEGYKKELELVGVGYRVTNTGQLLDLSLGYAHNIYMQLPKEVKVETKAERNKNPLIILESADKQLLGQICAKIRSFRMPEPYKGKGIKFVGEEIRRKSGKSAGK